MENSDIVLDTNDLIELIPQLSHWLIPTDSWVVLVNGRLWHSIGSNIPKTYWSTEKNARNSFERHTRYRILQLYTKKVLRGIDASYWTLPEYHLKREKEIVEQGLKLLEDNGIVEYVQITENLKFKKDE